MYLTAWQTKAGLSHGSPNPIPWRTKAPQSYSPEPRSGTLHAPVVAEAGEGTRRGGGGVTHQGSLREWERQQRQAVRALSPDSEWRQGWRDWSPGEGRVR